MNQWIYSQESYKILGACFEVYKEKGSGFLEPVYQECLEFEFELQGILYLPQQRLPLTYKGRPLTQKYTPDFVCDNKIIVELKAIAGLTDEHRAQVLNYLHATRFKLGLLINFRHYPKLEYERLVL
jgi:GxxExxY protein